MPSMEACSSKLKASPKTKRPVVAIIRDHPAEDVPMPKLSALLTGPPGGAGMQFGHHTQNEVQLPETGHGVTPA